tara:strand:+ start:8 stop:214 length:207 start_codon:yes stop_codon:yes gene_type:complete
MLGAYFIAGHLGTMLVNPYIVKFSVKVGAICSSNVHIGSRNTRTSGNNHMVPTGGYGATYFPVNVDGG